MIYLHHQATSKPQYGIGELTYSGIFQLFYALFKFFSWYDNKFMELDLVLIYILNY